MKTDGVRAVLNRQADAAERLLDAEPDAASKALDGQADGVNEIFDEELSATMAAELAALQSTLAKQKETRGDDTSPSREFVGARRRSRRPVGVRGWALGIDGLGVGG